MVGYTTVLACYCCYCLGRFVVQLCTDDELYSEPTTNYWEDLRRLDEYNQKGRVDKRHSAVVTARLSREDSLVMMDRLVQHIT